MRGKGGFCLLELVPGYHMMQKPIKLPDVIITPLGEQRWWSGESIRLPPMWFSFKSRRLRWRLRQMWVEFVISSFHCPERYFSGYSGFLFSSKTSISKFQFDQESGRRGITLWMCYLQIIICLFILFITPSVRHLEFLIGSLYGTSMMSGPRTKDIKHIIAAVKQH